MSFAALDSLIAQMEGYGQPGVYATVNNNPGNIKAGSFATANGATGQNGPFAVFPDSTTGFTALDNLMQKYSLGGATLSSLTQQYAPASDGNDPTAYSNFLSKGLGVTPDTPVSSLAGAASPNATPSTTSSGVMSTIAGAVIPGFNLFSTRTVAFVLGIAILIIGLISLSTGKAPQQIVVNTAKAGAKKAAEVAAA